MPNYQKYLAGGALVKRAGIREKLLNPDVVDVEIKENIANEV